MSTGEFEQFAAAMSHSRNDRPLSEPPKYQKIAILGGDAEARMLAAASLAAGLEVSLFSAYGQELTAMRNRGSVTLRGEGPIGSFHVDQSNGPSIQTTAELDTAIADAEVIILTGPVHKQRTYAMVLAEHLHDGQVVVLPNARTFGCVEVAWLLRVGGCQAAVTLVDIPGLPFWVNEQNGGLHLSRRSNVAAACLPAKNKNVLIGLATIFPNLTPQHSCLHTGFHDGSSVVDAPALLLGGCALPAGGPEVPYGGVPLAENHNFRNLLGDGHISMIAGLWQERCRTAQAYGVRDLPDVDTLLDQYAGTAQGEGMRAVPDTAQSHVMLRSAIIGSLSPLVSAAELAGVATPLTQSMIQLGSTLLDGDLQSAGRRLDTMGVRADNIDDARRVIDRIVSGQSSGNTSGGPHG